MTEDFINNPEITKLLSSLRISKLRKSQISVINFIYEKGDDLLAIMPTSSGKTLCFMISSILFNNFVIIVYPLLSLMNDQYLRFKEANISVAILKGGMERKEKFSTLKDIENGKVKVLITNIEMLLDEKVQDYLRFRKNPLLIFDEVHTLVEWGMTFRKQMLLIKQLIPLLNPLKILAFSATVDEYDETEIYNLIFTYRNNYKKIFFSANRENIFYSCILTLSRRDALLGIVKNAVRPLIVFSNNRIITEQLSKLLSKNFGSFETRFYHAGLGKGERQDIEKWFRESDNSVLVATSAYGMGVDKGDIRTVIHYNLPNSVSSFLQESGRAGRDGRSAYSFVIIKRDEIKNKYNLDKTNLLNVFLGKDCIRSSLLKQMGEKEMQLCTGCSNCFSYSTKDLMYEIFEKNKKLFLNTDKTKLLFILKGLVYKGNVFLIFHPLFGLFKDTDFSILSESYDTFIHIYLNK